MESFVERMYPGEFNDLFERLEDPPYVVRPKRVPPPTEIFRARNEAPGNQQTPFCGYAVPASQQFKPPHYVVPESQARAYIPAKLSQNFTR